MPDYSEVLDHRATQPATPGAPSPQQIMALLRASQRGAAVLTELLDSQAWNVFRSNVGGELEVAKAERDALRERVEAGELVGDERARSELRLQYLRGKIEALTLAMDLPRQLIGQHERLEKLVGGNWPASPAAEESRPRAADETAAARAVVIRGRRSPESTPKPRRRSKKS